MTLSTSTPSTIYKWCMKSIAFECDREYIIRDDGGPRLVTPSDILLFHENGLLEVIPRENLHNLYQLDFSLDSKIRIYQKKINCYAAKMDAPFLVKQNSYYHRGNPGNYFVQDLSFPYYQYVFNEHDYFKYLKQNTSAATEVTEQVEEHEHEHEEEEEEEDLEFIELQDNHQNLEEKYSNQGVKSSFFSKKFWISRAERFVSKDDTSDNGDFLRNSSKTKANFDDIDVESVASGEYIEPSIIPDPITLFESSDGSSPVGLPLTWNLKHGKYLGIEIRSSAFSIEYQDSPLTPQSERFRGRRGDILVLNCGGYIFGIFTLVDFHRLCDNQPLVFSPDTQGSSSCIHLINFFLAKKILTKQIDSVSSALWDGSIELGRVGEYLMQLHIPGNSSLTFITRKVEYENNSELTQKDSIISNDMYQWITSASDLEEYFSSFPPPIKSVEEPRSSITLSSHPDFTSSVKSQDLSESKQEVQITPNSWVDRIDLVEPQKELLPSVLHYFSPFDIFSKDTCCWCGKLDRYIKRKQIWKVAYFIIYSDRICLIPVDSNKRKKSSDGMKRMKYFLFSECTEISFGFVHSRDCIQLHGIGKKRSEERKSLNTSMKSVFALFSGIRDDTEYFALRNQSKVPSMSNIGSMFDRDSFVNMNAIKQHELHQLFIDCYLWSKRQQLYQLTYQLFEIEETQRSRTSRSLSLKKDTIANPTSPNISLQSIITFFDDSNLTLSYIEKILTTPIDESEGMIYLHKLASYPYDISIDIMEYILFKYYSRIPTISPLNLCCHHQVDALHIAFRCNNEKMIQFLLSEKSPCSQEFLLSSSFQELSIHSYLCYPTTISSFDLISSYCPSNLFITLDSQENTLLMLLLSHGSISIVLHLLQTTNSSPSTGILLSHLERLNNNSDNIRNYFNFQNWKHQHALSLTLSLFHFYSTTLTESLCSDIHTIVMSLLEKGCDPNLPDLYGNNCLHIISSIFITFVNSLHSNSTLSHPHPPHDHHHHHQPHHQHHMIGYHTKLQTFLHIMKLFITYNCHIDTLNNKGETSLSILCQIVDYSLPEDLLKELIDTLIGLHQNDTIVGSPRIRSFSASEMGNILSKQLSIINHSFGNLSLVSHTGIDDHLPLHIAAYNGHVLLLTHLINRGGDIHRKNKSGETPMDIVMKRQQMIRSMTLSPSLSLLQHGLDACYTLLYEQRGNMKYHLERRKSIWNIQNQLISNEIIYSRHKDGHYEIKSGVVPALITLLCSNQYCANEDDIRAVVLSYHLVGYSHIEILKLIFHVVEKQIQGNDMMSSQSVVKCEDADVDDELDFRGVVLFLVVWFSWRKKELEHVLLDDSKEFMTILREIISLLLKNGKQLFTSETQSLILSKNDYECFSGFLSLNTLPATQQQQHRLFSGFLESLRPERKITETVIESYFLSLDPRDIVQQCSLAMHELLQQIPLEEFLSSKYDDPVLCPHLTQLKIMKDRLKSYFINEILSQSSLSLRSKVIYHLLSCAFLSLEIYFNYELVEIISSTFSDQPIYRLKNTFSYVESQYPDQLQRFYDLIGQGCRNLKKLKVQYSTPPVIPPLGLYCGDLRKLSNWPLILDIPSDQSYGSPSPSSLTETKDTTCPPKNENEKLKSMHLNLFILRTQSCILREIQKAQEIPYRLRVNENIQKNLINCPMYCMDEKVLDARSYQLEARRER